MTREERLKADPVWAAEYRRKARERMARRYADPEIRAQIRAAQNARSAEGRVEWVAPAVFACATCGVEKPLSAEYFGPRTEGRLGFTSSCRSCLADKARERRSDPVVAEKHREYARQRSKVLMQTDPEFRAKRIAAIAQWSREKWADPAWRERELAKRRERYAADPEYRARKKARKPGQGAFYTMQRHVRKRRAMPEWADRSAIRRVYAEARRVTLETGVVHHVDHEVPLVHPLVSGLHVPANLQVIPGSVNRKKSNLFVPG